MVKNLPPSTGDARDAVLISGLGRSPGVENSTLLQVFLPGKFHGQRSLGCSPWGCKELGIVEHARTHTHTYIQGERDILIIRDF